MPYIIDGNNLIGCAPDIALDDPERRTKIITLVRKYQENRNTKITLVFDGDPGDGGHRQMISAKFSIKFPLFGQTADEEIKKILLGYTQLQDVVVVTSDRDLKSFARERGAKTRNSIEFYYELRKIYFQQGKKEETQKRIHASLSEGEVDKWMKIFKKS